MSEPSQLQLNRLLHKPSLPQSFNEFTKISFLPLSEHSSHELKTEIKTLFPHLSLNPYLNLRNSTKEHRPLRVGVVLSGGQAPGGHNVITGLYDALKKLNAKNELIGFINGPSGIIKSQYKDITQDLVDSYRNQGGFDMIGSGRTKIETSTQLKSAEKTMLTLELDGLVVIGGDDSNTNAAILAEYFLENDIKTAVVGVPKTIDGDLKNKDVEVSFGFDTASKTYSDIIGNLMRDAMSAKKYYYFIKLMGRSASHITLECALQTHPNLALISEEVASKGQTLNQVIETICDIIVKRSCLGKDYGVILIPEGIIEFIPEVKILIAELNELLSPDKQHAQNIQNIEDQNEKVSYIAEKLSEKSLCCFKTFPKNIQEQLLIGRDDHGNVQVSKIETERLLIDMVSEKLKMYSTSKSYFGKFNPQPHFCGYEGRSCFPSNFDSQYCYVLGHVAALLLDSHFSGYMCSIKNLTKPIDQWEIGGIPLTSMIVLEDRHGEKKPVIQKALVDLKGKPFLSFMNNRQHWTLDDNYQYPGPIQFFGPSALCDSVTLTMSLEA